jgi:hypothetical protein
MNILSIDFVKLAIVQRGMDIKIVVVKEILVAQFIPTKGCQPTGNFRQGLDKFIANIPVMFLVSVVE